MSATAGSTRQSHRRSAHSPRRRGRDVPQTGPTLPAGGVGRQTHEAKIAPQLHSLVVPIESVTLHPNNPRRGDVDAVAASLARFGQQKPIVVQASTRYVVAGNHLVMAARSLGWTEIAANVEALDDASSIAFMLADNRTADLGGYDDALLDAILAEQEASANLAATGYNADDVAAILAAADIADTRDADAAPPLPEPADLYVEPGDLWALGRHRLLCGDATDPAAVALLVGGDSVDLLWSDPPYSVAYTGKTAAALTIANDDLGIEGARNLVAAALRLVPLRRGGAFYLASPAGPAHLAFLLADYTAAVEVVEDLATHDLYFVGAFAARLDEGHRRWLTGRNDDGTLVETVSANPPGPRLLWPIELVPPGFCGAYGYPEVPRPLSALNIEATQHQSTFVREMLSQTRLPAVPVHPDSDKVTRSRTLAARFEGRKVYFLRGGPDMGTGVTHPGEFPRQLLAFPNGEHDDLVDAAVYAADLNGTGNDFYFTAGRR